jgi:UDP-N-acetyl-D-mannosaminuronic acid dehydrogenase
VDEKIAVVGLGNAGLPLAAVIADNGIEVTGVDINRERCDLINRGINPLKEEPGLDELIGKYGGCSFKATTDIRNASSCNIFIVIVPLFIDQNYNPDFRTLESAIKGIGSVLKPGDLVILETTVPPGTTDNLARAWLEETSGMKAGQFGLAYSPERIMTGYSISRFREFPKVVGGTDEESGKRAFAVYSKFVKSLNMVSSARVAEFIKVIEGCYRDTNIALANELFKISYNLEIDFYEAREYANHQYCHIHLPSTGVGGHCIPVYPWFLIKEMERGEKFDDARLLRTSRELNDEMIEFWAEKIMLNCLKIDKPIKDIAICISGLAYRRGVKEIHHSRNLALARHLVKKGLKVYACDELLEKVGVEKLGLIYLEPEKADLVFDTSELMFGSAGKFAGKGKMSKTNEGPVCRC